MTAQPTLRALLDRQITERDFMAQVIVLAKLRGWRVMHQLVSKGTAHGWPDLVLVRRGQMIVRELKTVAGRVRPEQQAWLDDLGACGLDVGVWRPGDWSSIEEVLR